jgi:predicted membrane protein
VQGGCGSATTRLGVLMLGKIARIVSFVLLAWFVFLFSALILAAVKKRDVTPPEPDADEVDLVASFEPLEFHSTSTAFRGGKVTTWFGGGVVDLRDAVIDPDGATLEVNALFGGGNLVVPEDWNIETRVIGLGGIGDGRTKIERSPDAPTLRVEGQALFGGWGITSRPADEHDDEVLSPV